MMRQIKPLLVAFVVAAGLLHGPARGQDVAGSFDYYVLSLSWSPNWCVLEGDARHSPQCAQGTDFGWVLHGLWPQHARGWPQNCRTRYAEPTRTQTAGMADIMGTSGLAWYQWNKHGTCSGLSPADYYALARQAHDQITRPPVFSQLSNSVRLPASIVEAAFLRDNPGMTRDQITITCRGGHIQEARICLTRDLALRRCGEDVIRDCTLEDAVFTPVR
jgi:ribonuclease T2